MSCKICFSSINIWIKLILFNSIFLYADTFQVITLSGRQKLGMFASANQVLGQISLFETKQLSGVSGIEVDFGLNGLYYDPSHGPNWWSYFFEPLHLGNNENAKIIEPSEEQYRRAWEYRYQLSRDIAAQIVEKYIRVKPHIQEKVDDFVQKTFQNYFVIGVHYRGTDKGGEAPRVSYDNLFMEIDKHLQDLSRCLIFVATDEIDLKDQLKKRYPGIVATTDAQCTTAGGPGIHFLFKQNYQTGEEALIDCLLLSKCNMLIRTSSNLSLWSTYFNPNLPVILLNRRWVNTLEPE